MDAILERGAVSETERKIGVVGLGKMGGGIAHHAMTRGMRVYGFDQVAAGEALQGRG